MTDIDKKLATVRLIAELKATGEKEKAMLKPDQLPAPTTLIEYPEGSFGPLMFHYATEGENLKALADEQGFELEALLLDDDVREETIELRRRFDANFDDQTAHVETLVADWTPPARDGLTLVAKWDTEDGPIALYVRPTTAAAAIDKLKGTGEKG